jgi:hypothetical protein
MDITFLSPSAALIGLAVLLPVVAFALSEARARAARVTLRLPAPATRGWSYVAAIVAFSALLAIGAAQPVFERERSHSVRGDAEALFVFDTTRSMAAADSPGDSTRFERARALGRRLRSAVPELRVGLATVTDRVLPHLFPTGRSESFQATLSDAIGIEQPASVQRGNALGSSFEAFAALPKSGFFTEQSKRRVLVVFTDAESRPFDPDQLRLEFRQSHIRTAIVRVGHAGEQVFTARGEPEPGYQSVGGAEEAAATFSRATGGRAFEEDELGSVVDYVRSAVGTGGPRIEARDVEPTPLAAWAFGAAFLPLAFLLWRRNVR